MAKEESNASKVNSLASVLGDPTLARSAGEDPVAQFLLVWWRQIVVVFGAALAIFYGVNMFRETREEGMRSAGDQFFEVQRNFEEFHAIEFRLDQARGEADAATNEKTKKEIDELEKTKTDTKRRLDDAITALADAHPPYNRLAALYRVLVARETGDSQLLTKTLDPKKWKTIIDRKSDDRFFSEIEAVAYARALLDSAGSSEGETKEARELLKELAIDGSYAEVTAALAFSSTAQTPDERTEALQLLEQVQSAHTEQSSLLENEIKRLKS